MKGGFTLLELIIVVIIVGILATLGTVQYQAVIEKSRGAEARQVLSTLRSSCAAIWMQNGDTVACTAGNLGLSTAAAVTQGEMPGTTCWPTNYFIYTIGVPGAGNAITFRAIRCIQGGKAPQGRMGLIRDLRLAINYLAGTDVWTSTGGY